MALKIDANRIWIEMYFNMHHMYGSAMSKLCPQQLGCGSITR